LESSDIFEKKIYHKFQRCPYCKSYSIKKNDNKENILSRVDQFECTNCLKTFSQNGSTKSNLKKSKAIRLINLLKEITPYAIGLFILICIFYIITILKSDYSKPDPFKKPAIQSTVKASDNLIKPVNKIKPPVQNDTQTSRPEHKKLKAIKEKNPPPITYNNIILGNYKIFGVNWIKVDKGLEITRINRGPFKNAGLRIGDIITSVDKTKIKAEGQLLSIRDEIIRLNKECAKITVIRKDKLLHFKIKKS
jgi:hypothetical protein